LLLLMLLSTSTAILHTPQAVIQSQAELPLPGVNRGESRAEVTGQLRRWHRVTLTFTGPDTSETADPNPFTDYRLNVTFTNGAKSYVVPGFYAADGDAAETSAESGSQWRVHFTPDEIGTWSYLASFRTGANINISLDANAGTPTAFDGDAGTFEVEETNKTDPDFRFKGRLEYVGAHHLRFAGDGTYYLKHGANSPENFLAYDEFDGTYDTGGVIDNFLHDYNPHAGDWNTGDPTWKNGKGKNIIGALNYLNTQDINNVYFLTYNIGQDPNSSVPGDGMDTWMWISPDEADRTRYDVSKLDQWEIVFQHMDKLGIQLHVVTQEEENDESLGGSSGLNDIRKLYYRELVARFGHHLAVQWNLGEENDNSDEERIAFANYFRALDPYDHPIAVHTGYNAVDGYYDGLVGQPGINSTSMQGDGIYYNQWTITWRQNSAAAGTKWSLYGDEQGPAVLKDMSNIEQIIRESQWGNLMGGGAGTEWYFGYQPGFGDLQSEDWRMAEPLWQLGAHAITFFETYLPFWEMNPDNDLVDGDAWALAKPGEIYAVYLPTGITSGAISLNIQYAIYEVLWYNPKLGGALQTGSVTEISGQGSKSLGEPPDNPTQEWVALVRRTGTLPTFTPTPSSTPTPTPNLTPTVQPTFLPDTEMLQNGGFEIMGADGNGSAQGWKANGLAKSKRVCDKPEKIVAHTGDCAFRLNAVAGINGGLSQKVGAFGDSGDTLSLRLWVTAKKLGSQVEISAKVKYPDGTKQKLTIAVNTGTFVYTELSKTLALTGGAKNAKVVLRMPLGDGGGKYWVDDVSLTYSE
jgi:hypothetical protein